MPINLNIVFALARKSLRQHDGRSGTVRNWSIGPAAVHRSIAALPGTARCKAIKASDPLEKYDFRLIVRAEWNEVVANCL